MCYFITIAVPSRFAEKVRVHLRPGYGVGKTANPSFTGFLPEDHTMFTVTSGMCSCDLFQPPGDPQKSIDKIREQYAKPKYQNRGWSNAKIERAIQDKIRTLKHGSDGLSPALRQKLCDIVHLTSSLFIVVHWYASGIDEETIPLMSEKVVSTRELIHNDRAVVEDTWVALKL